MFRAIALFSIVSCFSNSAFAAGTAYLSVESFQAYGDVAFTGILGQRAVLSKTDFASSPTNIPGVVLSNDRSICGEASSSDSASVYLRKQAVSNVVVDIASRAQSSSNRFALSSDDIANLRQVPACAPYLEKLSVIASAVVHNGQPLQFLSSMTFTNVNNEGVMTMKLDGVDVNFFLGQSLVIDSQDWNLKNLNGVFANAHTTQQNVSVGFQLKSRQPSVYKESRSEDCTFKARRWDCDLHDRCGYRDDVTVYGKRAVEYISASTEEKYQLEMQNINVRTLARFELLQRFGSTTVRGKEGTCEENPRY